ncbi:MAG TPA: hypothetical protein VK843_01740 [Planctomycetota bacterium]|nr:hypothetical protein [Planctomycetota bacterium]
MIRMLLPCVAWLASMSAATATDYYVDINGTAPGTGTLADPFTSIQYAATRPYLLPDDTLLVAPGTYVGNITNLFCDARSLAGPEVTVIAPSTTGDTVTIDGLWVTLEGFTVLPPLPPYNAGFPSNVFVYEGSLKRCVLRNDGARKNGGIWVELSGTLRDCTITGLTRGVFINGFGASCHMHDSIITGNVMDVAFSQQSAPGVLIAYCAGISNVDPNVNGPGNLQGNVGFWDAARPDHHLQPGSVCIDAGDPASPLDPDGSRHDIGAYTFQASYAPAPASFCAGKSNSDGCVPAIGSSGVASATSPAPFLISASNEVANKPGLLMVGVGKVNHAFQGGRLCVASPIKRAGIQSSGGAGACAGSFVFDMAAHIQSGAQPSLIPGAYVACQWWGRDPLDPAGFGSSLSDAISFGIAP